MNNIKDHEFDYFSGRLIVGNDHISLIENGQAGIALSKRDIEAMARHYGSVDSKDKQIAELENVMFDLLSLSSFAMSFPFEYNKLKKLRG
tara:strand:- start:1610 stop:1879 length:270 start_codon:yes stop_codon:yes gene_type:complete